MDTTEERLTDLQGRQDLLKVGNRFVHRNGGEVRRNVASAVPAVMHVDHWVFVGKIGPQVLPDVTVAAQTVAKDQGRPIGCCRVGDMKIKLRPIGSDEPLAGLALDFFHGAHIVQGLG